MVQCGLSYTIRLPEPEPGGPLPARSPRRAALMPAGRVLPAEAGRVPAAARAARLRLTQVPGVVRGPLRIGFIRSLAPFVDLPASLGRFRAAPPGIDIALHPDGAGALPADVAEGRLALPGTPVRGTAMRLPA
ncbi:hypothetical protein [Pseudoxanthobacter sp.]|uniref:hypothetical protein n=1 Tax=Pseudoxanthobacter sp. TaxID=1925742 RepID=UPI002FE1599C